MGSIERGTRWVVFEAAERNVWQKVERQVQGFLRPLGASGVFGTQPAADSCQVVCDERVNGPEDVAAGRVNILDFRAIRTPGPLPVVPRDPCP